MRLLMLCLLLIALLPVNAQSPAFDLCDVFETYSRGDAVLFDGAAYRFDMPDDLIPVNTLYVTDPRADFENAQLYMEYYSPSRHALYVFAFRSLKTWTDGAGEHNGTHDFCYPPKRIQLPEIDH